MADTTIEWVATALPDGTRINGFTFNPWWGCEKIDPECKNCYAATFAKRVGQDVWGGLAPRRFFGEKHWAEPLKWNRLAERSGLRRKVFCASMADVFEDRADLEPWRAKLWGLIHETPNLDWMLLTKRPENMRAFAPQVWERNGWPSNVMAGTTAGCQGTADDNLPQLLEVPARLFVSCEPLLSPIKLTEFWSHGSCFKPLAGLEWYTRSDGLFTARSARRLSLVIAGAESGGKARHMEEAWVRALRDQCAEAGVPFFYKQKIEGRKVVSLPLLDGRRWAEEARP